MCYHCTNEEGFTRFFHAKAFTRFFHAKAQRRKERKVVVRRHRVILLREDWGENAEGEEGEKLLFDRFLLNKMNLDSKTIIQRTSTLSSPLRPLRLCAFA